MPGARTALAPAAPFCPIFVPSCPLSQLPPTVVSSSALAAGLSVSLFERLMANGLRPYLLDTQYRMHPSIAAFPSAAFYGSRLISHPRPEEREPPPGFDWPLAAAPAKRGAARRSPVAFVAVAAPPGGGHEELGTPARAPSTTPPMTPPAMAPPGTSRLNRREAEVAAEIVAKLVEAHRKGGAREGAEEPPPGAHPTLSIAVITPYAAQARSMTPRASERLTVTG